MSRYIDAEWLKELYKPYESYNGKELAVPIGAILANIDDAPSIDIVRCAECKHNYNTAINHGKMHPRCDFTDRKLTENDFCSRGEREGE